MKKARLFAYVYFLFLTPRSVKKALSHLSNKSDFCRRGVIHGITLVSHISGEAHPKTLIYIITSLPPSEKYTWTENSR